MKVPNRTHSVGGRNLFCDEWGLKLNHFYGNNFGNGQLENVWRVVEILFFAECMDY